MRATDLRSAVLALQAIDIIDECVWFGIAAYSKPGKAKESEASSFCSWKSFAPPLPALDRNRRRGPQPSRNRRR